MKTVKFYCKGKSAAVLFLGLLLFVACDNNPVFTGYTLTIKAQNGTVTKKPDKSLYNVGDVVTLTAVADSGFCFWKWSGDAGGANATKTITMNADKNIAANFAGNLPVPGHWKGSASFTVSENSTTLSSFRFGFLWFVDHTIVYTFVPTESSATICDNRFIGSGSNYSFSGRFTSSTTVSGKWQLNLYPVERDGFTYFLTDSGTWSATAYVPGSSAALGNAPEQKQGTNLLEMCNSRP